MLVKLRALRDALKPRGFSTIVSPVPETLAIFFGKGHRYK